MKSIKWLLSVLFLCGTSLSTAVACPSDPYTATICVMAWRSGADFSVNPETGEQIDYLMADGRTLNVSNNTLLRGLYALIGNTYGGSDQTNFNIPNLQGRFVMGTGVGSKLGATGGAVNQQLSLSLLPMHNHTLNKGSTNLQVVTGVGNLSATTVLSGSGLSATTSLAGVTAMANVNGVPFSANGNSLTLNATSNPGIISQPSGKSLAKPFFAIYSSLTPGIAMAAGSISGAVGGNLSGSAPVVLAGNPSTTFSGNPSSVLGGQLTASLVAGSATDAAGNAAPVPVPIMPPYIALSYYIAAYGAYPVWD